MAYYSFSFETAIPEKTRTDKLPSCKSAWVSPQGDFYGFTGPRHLKIATYIGVFELDIHPDSLAKGQYLSESYDSRLLSLGWLSINDVSWLAGIGPSPTKFIHNRPLTQKQIDTLFDYCELHSIDFPNIQ